ncbi:MAG: DUF4854 domain-containing protein [Oscillospiraceae bacterium]|nr:DUF4854 domain-containing protein [Oscillospiraceae bacterium]
MKKRISALLLVLALAVGAVAFTACSSKDPDPTTTKATTTEVTTTAPEKADAPNGDNNNAPATLEALVAEQNKALEAANAASAGQYSIKVKADGSKLIYSYTYAMDLPQEALQAALDAAGQTYGGQIGAFKNAGYDISAVVLEFLNSSGEVVASKEFK